jgi:long-chain acyl-CoA synthetase
VKHLKQLVVGGRDLAGCHLSKQVSCCASGLMAMGCASGDRVAVLQRNSLEQLIITLAAQHIGASPVQLNWHGQAPELQYILKDSGARILVGHNDLLRKLGVDDLRGMQVVAVVPDATLRSAYQIEPEAAVSPAGALQWDDWLSAQQPASTAPSPAMDSVIYTSGTTGQPKGVRRFAPTQRQVELTERMRRFVTGIDAVSRVMVPAPLYHSAPHMFAIRAVHRAEALVLPARFDAMALLRDIERYRITHLYLVPTMFVRLLAIPVEERVRHDLSSLRFALHAGGPCAPGIKRAMIEWWGMVIHEYYGSTEAGPCTFCTSEDALRKPGTIGRVIDAVAIEVRDEQGLPLPAGEVGELYVRNDAYADFTYIDRESDRAALQRGNLMASGDLGYRDVDGYYYLCDRKSDLVISGGVNIYPAEIEAVILELSPVADCVVFGIPDPEFGESLAALVQLHQGQTLDAVVIASHLAERLASFKLPSLIELRENLPRDESGKIRKRLLRDGYWLGAGRRI